MLTFDKPFAVVVSVTSFNVASKSVTIGKCGYYNYYFKKLRGNNFNCIISFSSHYDLYIVVIVRILLATIHFPLLHSTFLLIYYLHFKLPT